MPKLENGYLILNELFNSHIHLGGSLFEDVSSEKIDLCDFIAFSDFWNERLKQKAIDKIAWNAAAKYSALLSKTYGVTSVCTMLGTEILSECNLKNSLIGYPVMNSKKLSGYLNNLEENYSLFRHNVLSQNMKPGIFLHSLYANDQSSLEIVSKLLKTYPEDFLQIHIAEDTTTTQKVFEKYGKSEIEILEKFDLLTNKTMLVHCCLLSDQELETVSKYGATVVICPESNIRVGKTPLNPKRLINTKINWLVATDGLGTGGTLNQLKQAKILKQLYPETSYDDLMQSITKRPDNIAPNLTKIKFDKDIQNSELSAFLIDNCDFNIYNENIQEVQKELELARLELKKYKPTKKDFESWKKGEQND